MIDTPVSTISFFRFKDPSSKWNAFRQMGLSPGHLKGIAGMTFGKMLGTGAGQGFRMWPNWGVYGVLQSWESEAASREFFSSHPWWQLLSDLSAEHWITHMQAFKSHGSWDGSQPFVEATTHAKDRTVGILTRATIARPHLWHFWSRVARVSRAIQEVPIQPLFSMGVGELPIVQQATFSFWRNTSDMMAYAYQHPYHKEVVMKTRQNGWYSEELFARFHPYQTTGTLYGANPLSGFL